ncbi:MAG: hypothetical protein ACLVJ6_17150 [Merdibacter sp.]
MNRDAHPHRLMGIPDADYTNPTTITAGSTRSPSPSAELEGWHAAPAAIAGTGRLAGKLAMDAEALNARGR